jgi:hypothetical protein
VKGTEVDDERFEWGEVGHRIAQAHIFVPSSPFCLADTSQQSLNVHLLLQPTLRPFDECFVLQVEHAESEMNGANRSDSLAWNAVREGVPQRGEGVGELRGDSRGVREREGEKVGRHSSQGLLKRC